MDSFPDASFYGDSINFWNFGRAVSSAGDVNGDGISDIIVGGVSYAAKVFITVSSIPELTFNTLSLFAEDILPSAFGLTLSTAGDVNKDGFDDFIIADYDCGVDLKGKAYLFYGGQDIDSVWDFVLVGDERPGKAFGLTVVYAGDLNGDTDNEILISSYGDSGYPGKIFIYTSGPTSIEDSPGEEKLRDFQLKQNYPNPFNPETVIEYVLPENSEVNISVYNILGRHIKTLIDEYQTTGYKRVTWDGKDQARREVSSGVYFYRLKTNTIVEVKKMLLLR
jgi:hypothetical protein